MQGVYMTGGRRIFGQLEQVRGDIVCSQPVKAISSSSVGRVVGN